jgi:hypothetical protein
MKISHFPLKTGILVVIISLIATGLTDVLLPHGPAVTMSTAKGNLATFSAVDYDNESRLEPVGEYTSNICYENSSIIHSHFPRLNVKII